MMLESSERVAALVSDSFSWGESDYVLLFVFSDKTSLVRQRGMFDLRLTIRETGVMLLIVKSAPFCLSGRWLDWRAGMSSKDPWIKKDDLGIKASDASNKVYDRLSKKLGDLLESWSSKTRGGVRLTRYVQVVVAGSRCDRGLR